MCERGWVCGVNVHLIDLVNSFLFVSNENADSLFQGILAKCGVDRAAPLNVCLIFQAAGFSKHAILRFEWHERQRAETQVKQFASSTALSAEIEHNVFSARS